MKKIALMKEYSKILNFETKKLQNLLSNRDVKS